MPETVLHVYVNPNPRGRHWLTPQVVIHWRRKLLHKQHIEVWGMATDGHDFFFLRVEDNGALT
jgi:hypothetical protein